jgi:hypothetical protein
MMNLADEKPTARRTASENKASAFDFRFTRFDYAERLRFYYFPTVGRGASTGSKKPIRTVRERFRFV